MPLILYLIFSGISRYYRIKEGKVRINTSTGAALPPLLSSQALLCAKEVSVLIRVSERVACNMMKKGDIKAFKLGGKLWRTTSAQVNEYVRREIHRHDSARSAARSN